MADREKHMRDAIDAYRFTDLNLSLRQAILLRDAVRRARVSELESFVDNLSKSIEYAYDFCRDQALKASIFEGSE